MPISHAPAFSLDAGELCPALAPLAGLCLLTCGHRDAAEPGAGEAGLRGPADLPLRSVFLDISSLGEAVAIGAAWATAFALPLRSWVFAVDETCALDGAGLGKSDCCCASIRAAARCAIARAERASVFIFATPAAVLAASVGGAPMREPEEGAAARGSGRDNTTVGMLDAGGLADCWDNADGAGTRLLPGAAAWEAGG